VNRGCFASVARRFPRGTLKIGVWSWLGYNKLQQSVEAERRSRKPLNPAAEVPARNVNTPPKTDENGQPDWLQPAMRRLM